jgi:hypothetical protein
VRGIVRFLIAPACIAASLAIATDAAAQGRAVPRPRPQHVVHSGGYRPYPAYRPYYRPYYGYPYHGYYGPAFGYGYGGWYTGFAIGFGFGYGYGWPGWYGYPYYAGYPYPYAYPYAYDYSGAARLEVKPRIAEVYVDGHLVGTVDDFDGWAQRLNVNPGEHELTIYLKGHQTYRQNVLFRPGATLKVEHVMQPLAAGETDEPRPVPAATPRRTSARAAQDYPPDEQRQPGEPVPAPRRNSPDVVRGSDQYGSLAVRVQPLDAEVLVDGESWQSPDAGSLTLQLAEGVHRVQVRKQGYRTYSAEVRVRRGDSTSVNVSLSRE